MSSNSTYTSIHLAERPKAGIIPGKTFTQKQNPVPKSSDLKDGQVIFKSLYLSLDPAMRGWLNDTRSYIPPVGIGEIMRGVLIGRIKASKSKSYPVGSYAMGRIGWTEMAIVHEKQLEKIDLPENAQLTDALGVLGWTGFTAYFGILDIGKVKAGDFVVVSGAAGATGSVVGQIAKIKGAKVLGLAGSDEKVRWLKEELGFDDALNYKDPEFEKKFRTATKGLIDVFFDNVGGDILDLALSRAKPHARFVMCGGISQYNSANPSGLKNYLSIITMRIRMQGFVVLDYVPHFPSARKQLSAWLASGQLKRKDTIIKSRGEGIGKAEEVLKMLYDGRNTGKLILQISTEDDDNDDASSTKIKSSL